MEGLIPMIFRSIKKSRTLKKYNSISTPPAYNIEDFYPDGYNLRYNTQTARQIDGSNADMKFGHRRQKSFNHVRYADGRYASEDSVDSSRQLVRFRSHRRMFSCITGA